MVYLSPLSNVHLITFENLIFAYWRNTRPHYSAYLWLIDYIMLTVYKHRKLVFCQKFYQIWNLKIPVVVFSVLTPYIMVGECQSSGLCRQRQYVPLKWWTWRQRDSEDEPEHCGKEANYHVHRNVKMAQWFITQYIIQLLAGVTINP